MRQRRVLAGGALLVVLAAIALILHGSMVADAGVHVVTVGTLPWSVAIDAGTGHVFVVNRMTDSNGAPTGEGSVSMLDAAGRAVLRTVPVGPDPRGVVVDSSAAHDSPNGRIFVADDDDASLHVLDAHSGVLLRTVPVGSRPQAVAVDPRTSRAFVVNIGDGTVSVLDTRRWAVIRTVHLGMDAGHASIAVDPRTSRVFVGAGSVVTVLDASSGAIVGTTNLNGAINGLAVDAAPRGGAPNGQVFVAQEQGVSVLNARDGRVVRTLLDGTAAGAVAVDARRHRLVVTPAAAFDNTRLPSGLSVVSIVDEHSGIILRTVPVGVAPIAAAVDARSGRAVVVNAGGSVPVSDPWAWVPSWLRARIPWIAPPPPTRTLPGSVSVFEDTP